MASRTNCGMAALEETWLHRQRTSSTLSDAALASARSHDWAIPVSDAEKSFPRHRALCEV
jgi:hypothetical protein